MIKPMLLLALTALLTACVSPDNVRAAPEDTWTWQVNQNYQRFAHCLTDTLNNAAGAILVLPGAAADHEFRPAVAKTSHNPEVDRSLGDRAGAH